MLKKLFSCTFKMLPTEVLLKILTYPSSFFCFVYYHVVKICLFYTSDWVRRNMCNFHKNVVKMFYWLNKTLWQLTDNTKSRVEGDQPFYHSTTLRGNMMQLYPGVQKWLQNSCFFACLDDLLWWIFLGINRPEAAEEKKLKYIYV